MAGAGAKPFVDKKLAQRKVMLFSKSYVPECKEVKSVLAEFQMSPAIYEYVEIEKRQDVNQIENYFQILCLTDNRAVPQLFVDKRYIGGHEEIMRMHNNGTLKTVLQEAGALS
ncbi:glutaredoxin-1-like [Babylonia areolata]|uniref:glutaredoxin-1-like n=1 Tax=Babylonia areolata TaxID=304850 RepID=UPI003FD0BC44